MGLLFRNKFTGSLEHKRYFIVFSGWRVDGLHFMEHACKEKKTFQELRHPGREGIVD